MRPVSYLLFVLAIAGLWQDVRFLFPKYRKQEYVEDLHYQKDHPFLYGYGRRRKYGHDKLDIIESRFRIGMWVVLLGVAIALYTQTS